MGLADGFSLSEGSLGGLIPWISKGLLSVVVGGGQASGENQWPWECAGLYDVS